MEEELKANLRAVFEAFAATAKNKPSTIWSKAVGDARFMDRISSGASFTIKTYDNAIKWFSDNWPEDVSWPSEVARPSPSIAHKQAQSPFTEAAQ